jgi:hypothetical protein
MVRGGVTLTAKISMFTCAPWQFIFISFLSSLGVFPKEFLAPEFVRWALGFNGRTFCVY